MQTKLKPNSKTILCVDDDEDDRELINTIIKDLDSSYEIMNASNGEEALTLLDQAVAEEKIPCLVLLDINMPVMGGKETLKKIREQEHLQQLPVVVFTTSTNSADKDFFSKYDIEVRTKPDKFQKVVEEIRGCLEHCN